MKKFLVVLALVAFAATSFAANFTANGSYRVRMFNTFNNNYTEDAQARYFDQRFRLKFTADNGDGVKGVVYFEMGDSMWGKAGAGADFGADDKVVEVKNAYIQIDKAVSVKAGVFGYATPNSIVYDDDAAGISISKKFDMGSAQFVYLRLSDENKLIDDGNGDIKDERNAYFLNLGLKAGDINVKPYAIYEKSGKDAGDYDAYWLGANVNAKVADVSLNSNLVYGDSSDLNASGFVFDINAGMKVNDLGVNVYGLYGSGADTDEAAMPTISSCYTLGPKSVRTCAKGLGGFSSYAGANANDQAMLGANVTFKTLPMLTHTFEAAYLMSTDDDQVSDWNLGVIELYNKFQIAKRTKLELLLAYHMISDDTTDSEENAYAANFRLQFDF